MAIGKNALRVDQDHLDQVLLQAISDVLDERIMQAAVEQDLLRVRSGAEARLDRRMAIERELSLIESYQRNLVDAIAKGEGMDLLLAKLKAEDVRKKELIIWLDSLTKPADIIELDEARIKRDLRNCVIDAKSLLGRQRAQAHQILRQVLDKPLIFEAFEEGGQKGYKVTGKGSYLRLLPAQLVSPCVVSPTGDSDRTT